MPAQPSDGCRCPGLPVEASIALSIVFVASEIVHTRQGRYSVTQRYPWVVAFTFGLLHGFGFAGALAEVGLPQASIPIALLFFNVGVEIGQLLFVGAVLGVIAVGRRLQQRLRLRQPAWLWRLAPPSAYRCTRELLVDQYDVLDLAVGAAISICWSLVAHREAASAGRAVEERLLGLLQGRYGLLAGNGRKVFQELG